MSLVGSLEDLGLGDILQIISLSRKSGVLMLRSEAGEGQILFRDGRVTGAFCKGGPADLRSLLVGGGVVSEAEFAGAVRAAQEGGHALDDELRRLPALAGDALDELRRRNVERAALALFAWPTGEFSFDVREDLDTVDPALCVEGGIDAQFLAMEGARLRDEEDREAPAAVDASDPASFADLGQELRDEDAPPAPGAAGPADEAEPEVEAEPLEAEAEGVEAAEVEPLGAEAESAEAEPWDEAEVPAPAAVEAGDAGDEAEGELAVVAEDAPARAEEAAGPDAAGVVARAAVERVEAAGEPPGPRSPVPVVVVDPELAVLEWAKAALRRDHERVHIFQKTDLAIARIRQYLVRRETPVVVLSDATPPDPTSGARGPAEVVRRLKGLLPRMPVVALAADPESAAEAWGADAAVAKPTPTDLHNPRRAPVARERAEALRRALAAGAEPPAAGEARRSEPHALRRLREVSAELREALPRGRIIPVVLGFAAEHFARVALFLVRDELAVGMAGRGLERAGGPDDAALRELAVRADEPAWFRAVFERDASVRGPARDAGDRTLASLLGDREPPEAYVAPLESGERVIALLYGDNLPEGTPLPDTHALEVVLHEAGLALDRAALERQLAEMEPEAD